jgi:hypothetical protein
MTDNSCYSSESRRNLTRDKMSQLKRRNYGSGPMRAKIRRTYPNEEQKLSPAGEEAGAGGISFLSYNRTQLHLLSVGCPVYLAQLLIFV